MIKIEDTKNDWASVFEKDKVFSVEIKNVNNLYVFTLRLVNNSVIEFGKERNREFAHKILNGLLAALRNDTFINIYVNDCVRLGLDNGYMFSESIKLKKANRT